MKKIHNNYPLNQSCLFKLKSKRKLAELLELEETFLRDKKYLKIVEYSEFLNEKGRLIESSKPELKKVQKKILLYLSKIITPEYLISGKKGSSYLTNSQQHSKGKRYILTSDISKFYNSSKRKYIYRMFKEEFETSEDVAGILTDFVCYKNHIPTGAPTSQIISYFAYKNIFDKINTLSIENGYIFTLYVDDMTFSATEPIPDIFLNKIKNILSKMELKVKEKKTKRYGIKKNAIITGVCIDKNGEFKIPNKLRYSLLNVYNKYKNDQDPKKFLLLTGKIQAARNIEKDSFSFLQKKLIKKKPLS